MSQKRNSHGSPTVMVLIRHLLASLCLCIRIVSAVSGPSRLEAGWKVGNTPQRSPLLGAERRELGAMAEQRWTQPFVGGVRSLSFRCNYFQLI